MEAPELTDFQSAATKSIYGIDEKHTDDFGKQCLLARRMVERGVRFVSVNYSDESANPRWDQHGNMPKHADHARATDKPVYLGKLEDYLKTLVMVGWNLEGHPFHRIRIGIITLGDLRYFSLEEGLNHVFLMVQLMKLEEQPLMIEYICMTCMHHTVCLGSRS